METKKLPKIVFTLSLISFFITVLLLSVNYFTDYANDIEGIYFNEFREYVDAEGRVLTPAEIDEIRYKDDYREDIEQDFPHHR